MVYTTRRRRYCQLGLATAVVLLAAAPALAAAADGPHAVRRLEDSDEQSVLNDDYTRSKAVVTGISIPIGIVLCAFGGHHYKFSLPAVTFLICGTLMFLLGQAMARGTAAEAWVAIGCCAVGGIAGALGMFFSPKAQRAGVVMLGAVTGVVMALWLNTMFLRYMGSDALPLLPMYVFMGLLGVGLAGFSVRFGPGSYLPCVTSAFLGAYAFVHGVGFFVGGFMDPVTLTYSQGIPSLTEHKEAANWVYLIAVAVVWGMGAAYQVHRRRQYELAQPDLDPLADAHLGLWYGATDTD